MTLTNKGQDGSLPNLNPLSSFGSGSAGNPDPTNLLGSIKNKNTKKGSSSSQGISVQGKAYEEELYASDSSAQGALNAEFKTFGPKWVPAFGKDYKTTADYLTDYLTKNNRANIPPIAPNPWEMMIGACKFTVPPVNIQVSRAFQTGSLVGGAIRQLIPPKFNSGHSETIIGVTLYFPNQENIWGYSGDQLTIDFDAPGNEAIIDQYLSSLRGLITAFRYTPILPMANEYLNSTFDISAVALKTLTISTETDSSTGLPFPFCITVNLEMYAFDHTVYLPMVTQLGDAIDWGKYRQYMGRSAYIMEQASNKQFTSILTPDAYTHVSNAQTPANPNETKDSNNLNSANYDPGQSGNAVVDFSVSGDLADSTNIQFYYPPKDPAGLVPDYQTTANFLPSTDDNEQNTNWWNELTQDLGLATGSYGAWSEISKFLKEPDISSQYKILEKWLELNSTIANKYGPQQQQKWVANQTKGLTPGTAAFQTAQIKAEQTWLASVYLSWSTDPTLQEIYNAQAYISGQRLIDEWDVPMVELPIDATKTIVTSITTQTVNNFARLSMNMRDKPTYQHLGGLGTTIEVNLYCMGEGDLTSLRLMFDTIAGLSRLEHGHAVLGFLGLKNVIIALAGTKYVIPNSFNVQTINGMPHTYLVKMIFTDFDIFQQKREFLSSEQQEQLIQEFGKANPFLRLKQNWGAINAYPDFPLSVTEVDPPGFPSGKYMVGQLDPDYYFMSFSTIDEDLTEIDQHISEPPNDSSAYQIVHHLGTYSSDGTSFSIGLNDGYWDLRSGNTVHVGGMTYNEPHAGNTQTKSLVPGLTPASGHTMPNFEMDTAATSKSGKKLAGGKQSTTGLVDANFKLMMKDLQYRDQSGRMVRAYPTYMLWLINEGGLFAGQQLFDNFYGLQSVLDFSIVDNEDVMGSTLILRVSNLYSRLSTTYSQEINQNLLPGVATIINQETNTLRNLASGETNQVVTIDTVDIQPGVRLHLRAGYSSNPNLLQTIFNGVVTQVQAGDVMTITAQSDAIELGCVIDNTNTSGTTGDLSSMSAGLWFSEPRDLMLRLLSMGGSTTKEAIALATAGMIYSQNRFGIRHFGRILYDSMTENETANQAARQKYMSSSGENLMNNASGAATKLASGVGAAASVSINLVQLMSQLWTNFSSNKDLEIFARNIYPGNGTGIGQYTGGDLGDGGTATAFTPPGIDASGNVEAYGANGTIVNSIGQSTGIPEPTARQTTQDAKNAMSALPKNIHSGFLNQLLSVTAIGNPNGSVDQNSGISSHNWFGPLLLSQYTGPFAEVSFRATTYMKTVWDIFLECAALLPNYIIAVRPWENRSTVFYGKPHWAWTSGVIPVTTGHTADTAGQIKPDPQLTALQNQIQKAGDAGGQNETLYQKLTDISTTEWNKIEQGGTSSSNPSTTKSATTQSPATTASSSSFNPELYSVSSAAAAPAAAPLNNGVAYTMDTMTRQVWADFVLSFGGWPITSNNEQSLMNFMASENDPSTWTGTAGANNPLNNGLGSGGGAGLGSYTDLTTAAQFVAKGLSGGITGTAQAANVLASSGDPTAFLNAMLQSSWSSGKWANKSGVPASAWSTSGGTPSRSAITAAQSAANPSTSQPVAVGVGVATGALATQASVANPTVPDWINTATALGENLETYSAEKGALEVGVPVDFGTQSGVKDVLGKAASQVYSGFRNENEANQIWDDFRTFFPSDSKNQSIFDQTYPNNKKDYKNAMANFEEFMWTNAYHRGWIVLTADAAMDNSLGGLSHVIDDIPVAGPDIADTIAGAASAVSSLWGDIFGSGSAPPNPTEYVFKGTPTSQVWSFGRAEQLFNVYVVQGNEAAISWMQDNNQAGYSQSNALTHLFEAGYRDIFGAVDDAWHAVDNVYNTVKKVASTVIDVIRVFTNTISEGINLASYAGGQANLLNGIYNDSIYFDPSLGIGTLMWMCDNPFTREFGEPVVEVREPFQRVHYLNSFQHIIANGIVENSDQVATTVTCTSSGTHPVTVNFDKGAPAERQVEITVDDGLQWQAPSGFLGALRHPILEIRSFLTHFNNGDNATNASRVARWHLKENLKNIYTGELIILGDAQIRTHDLIYLSDSYEKMYGLFEVEQVVHQFSPETGFITSITPNAIVIINDPAKWQFGSITSRQAAAQSLRNSVRQTLSSAAQGNSLIGENGTTSINDFANNMGSDLLGTVQFTGGIGGIVKDFGGMAGIDKTQLHPNGGSSTASQVAKAVGNAILPGVGSYFANFLSNDAKTILTWPIYSWLRDNLYDAHSCYVQYMNRNGTPMDAGLSYNFGAAVGQVNVITFLGDALALPMKINGESTVSTSDLLTNLGWTGKDVEAQANALSLQENYTYEQVLKLSGQNAATIGTPPTVQLVSVTSIVDSQTFTIAPAGLGSTTVRLAFINGAGATAAALLDDPTLDLSVQAVDFMQNVIANIQSEYNNTHVVLRINPQNPTDSRDGAILATVFYRLPNPPPSGNRDTILQQYAGQYPSIQWDAYMGDGQPYTLNLEMLNRGYATINSSQFSGIDTP